MRLIRSSVAAGLLAAAAQPALACTPVLIVPELAAELSEEDTAVFWDAYRQAWEAPSAQAARIYGHQERMWREAVSVVVVRLAAFNAVDRSLPRRDQLAQLQADPTLSGVTLEPVRWLKGQGQPASFRAHRRGTGDCSVAAGWDHSSAKIGDIFVAYFSAGPLSDETLMDGLAPEQIVEPTVKALFALQQ